MYIIIYIYICLYIYIYIHILSYILARERLLCLGMRFRPPERELPLAVHGGAPIGMVTRAGIWLDRYTPTMAIWIYYNGI